MTSPTHPRPTILDAARNDVRFSDLTTLRVGGPIATYVETSTHDDLIAVVDYADTHNIPLVVLGGGSNIVAGDAPFPGIVVRDIQQGVSVSAQDACGGASVSVPAGHNWDAFVDEAITREWVGVECLAGIPGTVGAAPVQNIGAYGQDVSQVISSVRVWDREERRARMLALYELQFAYRDSLLKRSMTQPPTDGERRWGPSPRYIVLEVSFQFRLGTRSAPVAYRELAARLGVQMGERADTRQVADAVLALRAGKDMLEDAVGRPHVADTPGVRATPTQPSPADQPHDAEPRYNRWSAGSFFTNPIVDATRAQSLPPGAPRFDVRGQESEGTTGPSLGKVDPTRVKTSAAWLIEHAGLSKGFTLDTNAPAGLSTVHTLALTNRGGAQAADIVALAEHVVTTVREKFGITLHPEPVAINISSAAFQHPSE
ncbi:UDP-N-acetylmuramate dehydrogenase [Jonesia quinghaiensis]|uniref:UDP-N-acetylmuramate dehydrogenase n=1 Tax=Jonesia quinghaiensis TaxID=262806 RepID=UPI0004045B93|nr:UDP-N-acetylmuramate dehydrogenase [Jonesia quinghaiensis]